jgi:hypothetical protein
MFDRISTRTKLVAALSLLFGIQPALAQTANQVKQLTPVKLGTSGGNVHDASKAFCCSGTLGSLVTKGDVQYILSNNHVLADSDTATVGDAISQPGLVDVGCNAGATQTVATFSQAIPLHTGNNVDAAIAEVVPGEVDTSGFILEIGNPASTTAPDDSTALGRTVAKSGRTTGLTCATINSVSTNVKVRYQQGCGKGRKFTVAYVNQVLISSNSFSAGGDSGSLIVTADTVRPIALLFAGSSTTTIGNRISDVTSALGVSFVGPTSTTPTFTCPVAAASAATSTGRSIVSPAGFARAVAAKERHADRLMLDDAVIGVGVGASSEDRSEAVVLIYLEEGRAHSPLPAELDGVRTEVVRTDAFRAFGWNEPAQDSCSVK